MEGSQGKIGEGSLGIDKGSYDNKENSGKQNLREIKRTEICRVGLVCEFLFALEPIIIIATNLCGTQSVHENQNIKRERSGT